MSKDRDSDVMSALLSEHDEMMSMLGECLHRLSANESGGGIAGIVEQLLNKFVDPKTELVDRFVCHAALVGIGGTMLILTETAERESGSNSESHPPA